MACVCITISLASSSILARIIVAWVNLLVKISLEIVKIKNENILKFSQVWQYIPEYPFGQLQLNPLPVEAHVPPLTQGFEKHWLSN